jgi:hypothetical protein
MEIGKGKMENRGLIDAVEGRFAVGILRFAQDDITGELLHVAVIERRITACCTS